MLNRTHFLCLRVTLRYTTLCYVTLAVVLCYALLCYVMLRNVCITALHNPMLCSAMLRQLCFVLVLLCALLHYGTFVMLCNSTLRYLCSVTLCYVMLLLVTFITLHYATPWQAVALWHATLHYDMLYYVTVICAVFLRVVDWNRSDGTVIFSTVTVWFIYSDSPNKVCIHPLSLVSFLNEWKCLDMAPIIPGTPAIVSSIMMRLRVEQI